MLELIQAVLDLDFVNYVISYLVAKLIGCAVPLDLPFIIYFFFSVLSKIRNFESRQKAL